MNQLCCLCEKEYVAGLGRAICTPCYIKEDEKEKMKAEKLKHRGIDQAIKSIK